MKLLSLIPIENIPICCYGFVIILQGYITEGSSLLIRFRHHVARIYRINNSFSKKNELLRHSRWNGGNIPTGTYCALQSTYQVNLKLKKEKLNL